MKFTGTLANQCLIVLTLFVTSLPASEAVYRYDPQVVTLTGILDTRIYAGAPNYESVKKGDRPNQIWLIKLPHPISMNPDLDPMSFNEKETGIKELHVILTDLKDEKILRGHKGERVTLSGQIFHAHTIHHPLPLLMDVKGYKLHKPPRRN